MPPVAFADFAASPETGQVAALERLASRALASWDFASPRLSLVKYRENCVFAVREAETPAAIHSGPDRPSAILRVHRPRYRSDLDISSEIAWMRHLDTQGIATPAALAARDGSFVVHADDEAVPECRQCDLLAWVDGEPPGTLEGGVAASDDELRDLYRGVGELSARMHVLAGEWTRPEPFSRPSWDIATLVGDAPAFGRFEDLDILDGDARRVLCEARDVVRRRLEELGPTTALIHGDLVPDNILIDGNARRLIDFDDFGWSWTGFEMVTSLFPLQVSGGFDAGLDGYLEGYRGVRPFPAHELEALPDMLLARGFSYLGWPVGRPEVHSARDIAPMFAAMMVQAAGQYLESRR
jgi:Ser/Thr protein kinase RdoA (MazF antagonist)